VVCWSADDVFLSFYDGGGVVRSVSVPLPTATIRCACLCVGIYNLFSCIQC